MWIYGLNPVLEAIKSGRDIKELYLSSGRHEKLFLIEKEAGKRKIPVKLVDIGFFNEKFPKGHQGIAASVSQKNTRILMNCLISRPGKMSCLFFLYLTVLRTREMSAQS